MSHGTFYSEIDPFASAWLQRLCANGSIRVGEVDSRDMRDLKPVELASYEHAHFFAGIGVWAYALECAGWPVGGRVWTGSCPCQPFSQAGKGGGFADERHLWPSWFYLIDQCRPDFIFGEQVSSPDGLKWLDLVSADLEAAGYAIGVLDTCAAGVGAPIISQRLYWVAASASARSFSGAFDGISSGEIGAGSWDGQPERSGNAGIMAASEGTGWRAGRPGEAIRGPLELGRSRDVGELGAPYGAGLEIGSLQADERGIIRVQGSAIGAAGTLHGPWADAEWLYCTDEKWRPVEPGLEPLAHGAPQRMGRLRGYGNALVAPQAIAFVQAVKEVIYG